jgi:hypothetical protein
MFNAAKAVFVADPIMGSADAQHECRATFVDSNKITVDVSAWAPTKFTRERTSYAVVCSNGCTPAEVADWARRACKEYAESHRNASRKAG